MPLILKRVLAVLVSSLGIIAVAAIPAHADTVWNYGSAVIMVTTGAKNTSNHTQYVGDITIVDPGTAVCDGGTYEAWAGSVWYDSRVICRLDHGGTMNATTFYIGKWVPSGSGVCGSFWRLHGDRWLRHEGCITIRV